MERGIALVFLEMVWEGVCIWFVEELLAELLAIWCWIYDIC
jgi:hypothetical protein